MTINDGCPDLTMVTMNDGCPDLTKYLVEHVKTFIQLNI